MKLILENQHLVVQLELIVLVVMDFKFQEQEGLKMG